MCRGGKEGKNKWCHCFSTLSLSHTHSLSLSQTLCSCLLQTPLYCLDLSCSWKVGGEKPYGNRGTTLLSSSYSSKGTEPTESYGAALLFIWWANHITSVTLFLFMSSISMTPSLHYYIIIDLAREATQSFLTWVITKACFFIHVPLTISLT